VSLVWLWVCLFRPERGTASFRAYDRFANTELNGEEHETISSRAGRGLLNGSVGWCVLCKLLDWFEKDHCKKSIGY
jgi:hypothetical protein